MIVFYLILVLALVAGGVAALQLGAETGYVLLSYGPWVVETSLLGLVVAVAAFFLAIYYGLKLIGFSVSLPRRWRSSLEQRRADGARESFERGLLRLFEGHWKRAEVELVRRAADHHAGHLNYLAAARAAQRVGAGERRDRYLALVRERAPQLEFAILLTQAELQRERGEFALVRDTALQLRQKEPTHPYALELLAESHDELAEWASLRALLAEPGAAKAMGLARWRELSERAAEALLRAAVAAAELDSLKAVWSATPAEIQALAEPARAYAAGLARLNADAEARAFIEARLESAWDETLVRLYGPLHTEDPVAQLAVLERWLQLHGEQPALLETAGRVCLKNRLWGKARSYLEAVVQVAPTPAAYLELAKLCELTQAKAEADQHYRRGLEIATGLPGL